LLAWEKDDPPVYVFNNLLRCYSQQLFPKPTAPKLHDIYWMLPPMESIKQDPEDQQVRWFLEKKYTASFPEGKVVIRANKHKE